MTNLQEELARLKEDHFELQQAHEKLKMEHAQLQQEHSRSQDRSQDQTAHPNPKLSDEIFSILRALDHEDRNIQPKEIAASLQIDERHTRALLARLKTDRYARESPTGFSITDKGRLALHTV